MPNSSSAPTRLPQIFIPDDAPLDVADHTAEIGPELA
jgi:hypothetical protein